MPEESVDGTSGGPASVLPPTRSNRTVTPAIAGALLVLAASFALSVAFVLANGGLDLPAAQRPAGSGDSAVVASSAGPSTPVAGSEAPFETAATGASPVPSSSEVPGTPSPNAGASTPRPSSNRYDLLTACPNAPDCWVYVVRQGDNLFSIARYFGVALEVVEERNPWTATTQLVAGQKLLLPPPTR